jgi:hypothetical protein
MHHGRHVPRRHVLYGESALEIEALDWQRITCELIALIGSEKAHAVLAALHATAVRCTDHEVSVRAWPGVAAV